MILVNHYAIWPPIPKKIFIKHSWVKIIAFFFMLFHRDRFFNVCCLYCSDSLLNICSNSSSCHNVLCLQMKWWAAVMVVVIPSQKALLMCPYVSSGKFSVLAQRYSRALLHNLRVTSDCCLIFASHLATRMIPAITSFLAFYVSKGHAGYSNTFLRTLCFHFDVAWSLPSTCHMQGNWYCLALP